MRKIFLIVLVLFIGGCTLRDHYLGKPNRLVGAWKFKYSSLGPMVLKFKKDGTFTVDSNADGKRDIWGRYELLDNRVKFTDEMPRVTTDCYEPGFYYYSVQKGELNFDLVADHCKPRKYILSLRFVKNRR
jgi:hypothetical protein